MKADDLVVRALRRPDGLPAWSPGQWDLLVRQARRSDLLARIASLVDRLGLMDSVPPQPRAHLTAAAILAQAHQAEVRREIEHLRKALQPLQVPLILLKGAAYLLGGLPPASGRLFGDIDLLVPKQRLPEVEAALMTHGWATTHHSAYDQRYYRQWMHELPPLRHIRRQTVLDVHHAILPETARPRTPAAKLIAAARPIEGMPWLRVLAPEDMVLHSMAHLFHNDDLSHGLRDLADIDSLLHHFGAQPGFWRQLVERARELDLERPLYYGLRSACRLFGTPVPAETIAAIAHAAPSWPLGRLMDALWSQALRPPHASVAGIWTHPCSFALYVRAHWLRMPAPLLFRHLTIKAVERLRADGAKS